MLRLFAFFAAVLISINSTAQPIRPAPEADPYQLNENDLQHGAPPNEATPSQDVNSKTLRSPQTINTGIQNCVFISWGQSNWGLPAPTAFAPVNAAAIDNLNIYDSGIYNGTDPLVGSSFVYVPPPGGGNPILRVADALVTAGKCARVILVPIAINGTTIATWETGSLSGRIGVAIKRIQQRGIICGGTGVVCVMSVGIGESDCALGTTQGAFVASFNNIVTAATTAGFVGRWLINKESWQGSFTCAAIQNAQTQNSPSGVISNGSNIFLGANMDALVGNVCSGGLACRGPNDPLHLSDAGSISVATDATNGLVKALANSGAPF